MGCWEEDGTYSEPAWETEIKKLRKALREAMRYIESTDGTRGDLVGCAVNTHEFLDWIRLANSSIGRCSDAERQQSE
jgi:hypothetical protein